MKLLGTALMALCCMLGGALASLRLYERTRLLEQCISFLRSLKTELVFTHAPPPVLFRQLLEREEYASLHFTKESCRLYEQGLPFPQALEQSLNQDTAPFSKEERQLLFRLAHVLGAVELKGQLEAMEQIERRLEECYAQARDDQQKKSQMYHTFGMAAGATVLLLML